MLVDTHTHFYDEWLLPDAEAAIQRAIDAGVGKMIQADVDSTERPRMWEIGLRHPGVLFQMAGLYPGSVTADNWRYELDQVQGITGVVAIGEIGLDYHEGREFEKEQKEVLRLQLELAAQRNLPVNLHCFSGSYEVYEEANRYGDWSVGIGGVVTFKNSKLATTLERIPLHHILLETDAPYLAPVPHRGERNESSFLPLIAQKVAEVKGLTMEECERITTENAERLFNI